MGPERAGSSRGDLGKVTSPTQTQRLPENKATNRRRSGGNPVAEYTGYKRICQGPGNAPRAPSPRIQRGAAATCAAARSLRPAPAHFRAPRRAVASFSPPPPRGCGLRRLVAVALLCNAARAGVKETVAKRRCRRGDAGQPRSGWVRENSALDGGAGRAAGPGASRAAD